MRNWIKKLFSLYDVDDLIIGGHCGCCGKWIPNEIFEKDLAWGLCQECISKGAKNECETFECE